MEYELPDLQHESSFLKNKTIRFINGLVSKYLKKMASNQQREYKVGGFGYLRVLESWILENGAPLLFAKSSMQSTRAKTKLSLASV